MSVDPSAINARLAGTMAGLMGIRFVEASPDRVVAVLELREELQNGGGIAHGGTLMAFADTVGATATVVNLPPGTWTTTLESKTNFLAGGRGTLQAEATPLHKGRRTMVWQTRVTDESGRLVSMTTQTQMVISDARRA
jgi:1,4-dihydroxy-2-naphthoyl-CoA hydrolase